MRVKIIYMKRVLSFVVAFFAIVIESVAAEADIRGRVLDAKNGTPVEFATVALMRADSSIVAGTATNVEGSYVLSKVSEGDYLLRVSFIGYLTTIRQVRVTAVTTTFDDVMLESDATMLSEVVINDKVPIVEQQIDKLVVNVAQSAFGQVGSNALELLRKAPGVTVDKDGNVQLNGQGVAVWIDGRPSQLDGKSLEALLRSTDAASIDKIEIIANPSSKYDAAGQSGIINIRTKRTILQGLNGSIGGSYAGMGFRRDLDGIAPKNDYLQSQDLSLNLNYRTDKTNTFLIFSESTSDIGIDMLSETRWQIGGSQQLEQSTALYEVNIRNMVLKLGNDWFIDKKNTLGFIFSMPMMGMGQSADTNCNHSSMVVDGVETENILTDAGTEFKLRQYSANVNYTHVINEMKAAELTANIDYFHNSGYSKNRQFNYIQLPGVLPIRMPYLTTLTSNNDIDIYSAKVDWQSVVLGMAMLEAGGKWALSSTGNEMNHLSDSYNPADGSMINSDVDTRFNYQEQIGAGYVSLAMQLSKKLSLKAGLRGEYTYMRGDWISADTVTQRGYFDLFPTVFVGYVPSAKWRLNLSYTRRIQRPNYDQLNPFQNYVDAFTSNMGNPELKPCYSNNIYLSAGFGQHLSAYANCMFMNDVIVRVPKFDATTGQQTMLWDNFGRQTLLGGGLTLSELPLAKPLTLTMTMGAYDFRNVEGDYSKSSLYGSMYVCLTYNLPKEWKLQLDGWGATPVYNGYLHTSPNYAVNFAIKKTCFDKRLVCSLEINDIFRTMNGDFELVEETGCVSKTTQNIYIQKVKVGLTWNFGTAQKPLRHRKVGDLDESSRVGNSSGISVGGRGE